MLTDSALSLVEWHRCTAYCRDHRHATVIWLGSEEQAAPAATLRTICQREGIRYVGGEPAPEARPLPVTISVNLQTGASVVVTTLAPESVAWLLIWEATDHD